MKLAILGSNFTKGFLSLLENGSLIACERTQVLDGIMNLNVMRMFRILEKNSIIDSAAPLWSGAWKSCCFVSG